MDGGTASEAGEASSSHGRAGYTGAALVPPAPHPTPVTHPVAPAGHTGDVLAPNGPIVQLPHDSIAVEWWLARRAIEGYGAMPYTTDGVLALWPERRHETDRWTFGLEFEFATADAQWVAAELHARGLTASPEPDEYHGERTRGYWTVEQDHSVTSVFSGGESGATYVVGGEIVSPPLRDTPETWRQVATVLEVLRACGAEVNRSCGLHVHVGVEALLERDEGRKACPELAEGTKDGGSFDLRSSTFVDHDDYLTAGPERDRERALLPALSRLAMLASVCFEDLVFRMASAEGGRHRGQAFFYRHCRPQERPLQPAYASVEELAGALGKAGSARRAALNLTNVGDPNKDTVEFRQCNGTLDGRIVQAFCRLCIALVGAARWQRGAALLPAEPLGTHWRHDDPACARAAGDPQPLWRFLAAACPDGLPVEAAASLLWLFRQGTWQPSLATLASA